MIIREGRHLVAAWKLMCRLHKSGRVGRILARQVRCWIHIRYACHISPLSQPLGYVNIPHPIGIVIGHGVEIGDGATIYHNVTIGQRGDESGYPVIGAGAVIYTGAVVVGKIRIGEAACVGANAVVLHDVPPGVTAVGIPARCLSDKAETE